MSIDITDIKQAQHQAEGERAASDNCYDNLPVGVSVVDANGKNVVRNRFMHKYLGNDARSRELSDMARFRIYRPGTNVRLKAEEMPVARAFLKGEVVIEEELEILKADGSRAIVLGSAMPLRIRTTGW